ncbi:uncharacterized protein LOC116159053 [Photinus pyralis]|uniref:uncharacterized protein LOC116159053 n=1 Tax=Photinus pyralis TaxID=7054 RepID=UPI001266F11F|nr:uncharacterized protein LOC116159053 [Photinus pyralis]
MVIGYRYLQQVGLSECAFAVDVVIISGSKQELQESLIVWRDELQAVGMKINSRKTKVMVANDRYTQEVLNVKIGSDIIEQVQNFEYLGVTIEEGGKQNMEVNKRTENTLKMYYALKHVFFNRREMSRETKTKVYKSICRPILTYMEVKLGF